MLRLAASADTRDIRARIPADRENHPNAPGIALKWRNLLSGPIMRGTPQQIDVYMVEIIDKTWRRGVRGGSPICASLVQLRAK
jgi:hypothetical protein